MGRTIALQLHLKTLFFLVSVCMNNLEGKFFKFSFGTQCCSHKLDYAEVKMWHHYSHNGKILNKSIIFFNVFLCIALLTAQYFYYCRCCLGLLLNIDSCLVKKKYYLLLSHTGSACCKSWGLWQRYSSVSHSQIFILLPFHHWLSANTSYYKKSDWSREFDQYSIACEIDTINAISAANIANHVKFKVCLISKPLLSVSQF